MTPADVRGAIRRREWSGSTAGAAPGFAQANLIVVARDWAEDFRRFCLLNARPCPLLDVTQPGSPHPKRVAPDADLRTDLPAYRIHEGKTMRRVTDLRSVWRDDHVAFLLGCSFSFERALVAAGIAMRHIDLGRTVPMFVTNRACAPSGRLHGPLVVTMRPIPRSSVNLVRAICARYPGAHGEPVHVGDPSELGIPDTDRPSFGDAVPIEAGEVPAFWACGVTPQVVLRDSGCPWYASHEPGRMFVTDAPETVAPLA
jgi:uncharacterized protein YcsI (UPF0317 family)